LKEKGIDQHPNSEWMITFTWMEWNRGGRGGKGRERHWHFAQQERGGDGRTEAVGGGGEGMAKGMKKPKHLAGKRWNGINGCLVDAGWGQLIP
jgi:hypothetical protein